MAVSPSSADTGITPACAGNRVEKLRDEGLLEDHPRVCGEQVVALVEMALLAGSPPRVRGTVIGLAVAFTHIRITPACAGNSLPH